MPAVPTLESRLDTVRREIRKGNLSEAGRLNAILRTEFPRDARALAQASRIESLRDNYRSARNYALEASAAYSGEAGAAINILQRLQSFHLRAEILSHLPLLEAMAAPKVQLLDALATLLNQIEEPALALSFLEKGLQMEPHAKALLLSRAHTYIFLGRFDEAEADLKAYLRTSPSNGFAWWLLARLNRPQPDHNNVSALRRELANPAQGAQDKSWLAFALHMELDGLGEFSPAADALELACRTRRSVVKYKESENQELFEQLSNIEIAQRTHLDQDSDPVPIFIVGMHRSGTTLMEQFLDGHPQVQGLGELYDFTAQMRLACDHHCNDVIDLEIVARAPGIDLSVVGRNYLHAVEHRRRGSRFFTDKLPSNFLNLAYICQALPNAKILHMVRDPVATCFSNLREFFSDTTNPYSYDQRELGRYFCRYSKLMAHWHSRFPGRILDVEYANLTRDPELELERISRFCGFAYDPAMLGSNRRSVTTASAIQVRTKVEARQRPKFEPYLQFLSPLIDALGDVTGYQVPNQAP